MTQRKYPFYQTANRQARQMGNEGPQAPLEGRPHHSVSPY